MFKWNVFRNRNSQKFLSISIAIWIFDGLLILIEKAIVLLPKKNSAICRLKCQILMAKKSTSSNFFLAPLANYKFISFWYITLKITVAIIKIVNDTLKASQRLNCNGVLVESARFLLNTFNYRLSPLPLLQLSQNR